MALHWRFVWRFHATGRHASSLPVAAAMPPLLSENFTFLSRNSQGDARLGDCLLLFSISSTSSCAVYGLDAIAQQEETEPDTLGIRPERKAHRVIMQLLGLLGLDPAQTTVTEMHRLADSELFVCEDCEAHPRPGQEKIHFRSWTSVVSSVYQFSVCRAEIFEGDARGGLP